MSKYSPGTPLFLPHGARVFNRLVDYLRDKYMQYGFEEVITPIIYKKSLWAKSGHLDHYAEDMFTVTSMSRSRKGETDPVLGDAEEQEGEGPGTVGENEYDLKPMNCPGHCLIFKSELRSWRDLPIRYADFSPLHRNEVSGSLSGLTRVRRFHQDDGHIFCRLQHVEQEIVSTLNFLDESYVDLKLGSYRLALSTRPANHIGHGSDWDRAEDALKGALQTSGRTWTINAGDGAFYGPKIDVIVQDSDGKEHQTGTIQLDFQMPQRFELVYKGPESAQNPNGRDFSPVLIHRAILGSVERLMALLLENNNGKWPFWLHPRQVRVLTVNTTPEVISFATHVRKVLLGLATQVRGGFVERPSGLTVDVDARPLTVAKKVLDAKMAKYAVIVAVGRRSMAAGKVSVDATAIDACEGRFETSVSELLRYLQLMVARKK